MLFSTMKPRLTAAAVTLMLCLAGAASGQSRGWVRPPNFPPPFPTQIRAAEGSVRERQLNNLKAWNVAMIQYLQDKTNHYPDMGSAATVKKTLWRYVISDKGSVDPVTKRLYQPNPYLSRKSAAAISDPSKMVMFYEAKPNSDGTRAVGFADGHCALILVREWPRLKRASHIP